MTDLIRELLEEPYFRSRRDLLHRTREKHAPDASDPILVLSTGRVGTSSLNELLRGTRYLPFHHFDWQLAPRHRWEMLNRLLTGCDDREGLRNCAKLYLSCRLPEFVAAYRQGKTPVVVSHFDAIFLPVLLAFFDGGRIVHLHRDPRSVARSMIEKRQFNMGQLAPLSYTRETPAAAAAFLMPKVATLSSYVGWYMAFDMNFFDAAARAYPKASPISIASEDLFGADKQAYEKLRHAFPLLKTSNAGLATHYARKINEKQGHSIKEPFVENAIAESLAFYETCRSEDVVPSPGAG